MTSASALSSWLGERTSRTRRTLARAAANLPAAAPAASKPVFAVAGITGAGTAAACAADRKVAELLKKPGATDPGSAAFKALTAEFAKSPLSGLTTVTDMMLSQSGWDPHTPAKPGNEAALAGYGREFAEAPFFSLQSSTHAVSIGDGDAGFGIAWMLQRALALFVTGPALFTANQVTVAADGGIKLILSTYAPAPEGAATLEVQQTVWSFNTGLWPGFAEQVAGVEVVTADPWLAAFATPRQR